MLSGTEQTPTGRKILDRSAGQEYSDKLSVTLDNLQHEVDGSTPLIK